MSALTKRSGSIAFGPGFARRITIAAFLILAWVGAILPCPLAVRGGIVVVSTIALWATDLLPGWLVSLNLIVLAATTGLVSSQAATSGMTSQATWLTLGGIILSAALVRTGLAQRFADNLCPFLSGGRRRHLVGVVMIGFGLDFVMPGALGRVVLLVPILVGLARGLGLTPDQRAYRGVLVGGVMGTFLPSFSVLPSNVPNNVLVGAIETLGEQPPNYAEYLLLHLPVLGFVRTGLLLCVIIALYGQKPGDPLPRIGKARRRGTTDFDAGEANPGEEPRKREGSNAAKGASDSSPKDADVPAAQVRLLGFVLLLTVVAWICEPLHHIPASWVSMISALVCVLPGVGPLGDRGLRDINLEPVFYVAGIVSLATIVDKTGLAKSTSHFLLTTVPHSLANSGWTFFLLVSIAMVLGLFVTLPGVPAVVAPMSPALAELTGWSVDRILMAQVVGFSTVLAPYQAPPLVVASALGGISRREMTRVCLIMALLSIVICWPLEAAWWALIDF